jgi:RNA polymerase sigma-70 factor (ECF subfamily)
VILGGTVSEIESDTDFAKAWAENRSYLIGLAFRMLGDVGEAEDVVQEAFSRLARAEPNTIEDPRGWLNVVTSRLCLDRLGSARARHEVATDVAAIFDRSAAPTGFVDPADRITLDDDVRLALVVVLERLTPAERVVFVLHEVFQMPFEEIADAVGRSGSACRQLASRARRKVAEGEGRRPVSMSSGEERRVTERFVAACSTGDIGDLMQVLDADVSGDVDILPGLVRVGAEEVATNLCRLWTGRATLIPQPFGDRPAVLVFQRQQLRAVMLLEVREGVVATIHAIADPITLAGLRSEQPSEP